MKFKKFFALIVAALMLCCAIISVSAERQTHVINDKALDVKAATATYTLVYYSGMNCVRATNAIRYETNVVNVAQRNFPGYINMDVTMNAGYWFDYGAAYLTTTSSYAAFSLNDYYIPAGKIIVEATAYFDTNYEVEPDEYDGQFYYENSNYTGAYTSLRLVAP